MARGALTKELIDGAGNVADKVADWLRKEDEAQKWAHEKFPENFGPKSTPDERATFAGFPEKNYYHGTANEIDDTINSANVPMVDVGKQRDIVGFDDSFLGTTTKSDNQAHWFSDDPKTADTYADYNAYYKAYTNLQQEFERLRSKGLENLNMEAGDQWDDWINKLDPEDWLSVMTVQNKIKKLVDRGPGMGQQILPVRIRDSNQVATDTEGASWLGYFSEKDRTEGVRKGTELLEQAKIDGTDSVLFKNLNDTASKWYNKPSDQVAVLNPASIRSPLAHFDLKKLGLGGAGSYMSTNLMANPNDDLAQGIHDRANKRRQEKQVVPGTDIPYLQGGRDSQDYSLGGQFGIPSSPEAYAQQRFYNEHTYPGMAGVRGIGETLNSLVDTEKEALMNRAENNRNPLASEDPMGLGEFFIGEGGDFFENIGNGLETTGTQQLDAGLVGVDLMSGGSTKVARKAGQALYDTLDGTYINKGFDALEDIGGKIADFGAEVGGNVLEAGKAGAMVVGKGIDDALNATFQLPPGGTSPQLATADDSVESLIKNIEEPEPTIPEPIAEGPLQSEITPGYEFTETGGLLKPKEIDLSEHIGDEMISLPWDGTARGTKITRINDHEVDVDSHGGHQFLDDKGNIARGYIGASSKGVVDKILDRIWLAHKRSLRGGGTGRVIMSTVDMQKGGEAFAETPAMTAIQVIHDGSKQTKKQFNTEFKDLSASIVDLKAKNWGDKPFEGLPDIQTQEFEDIMLGKQDFFVEVGGRQKKLNPSKIRKALWQRMSNAGTQKLFKYNWNDLQDAQLRADKIVKGHVGNRMIIVNDPSTIKAVENQDPLTKNVYNTAIQGGDGVGTLDIGAQPEEIMFPERFRQAYERLKKLYPNRSHEQLKDNARGILSNSTVNADVYSETITGGLVDNVYKPKKTSVTVPKSLLETDSKSLWDYPDQKYTSANTSINKTKTAAAFTKLLEKDAFQKGSTNLDIGGGRFDNANDLLNDKAGAKNIVFDPFNRTKAHNAKVAKQVSGGKVDTVTINNTLNVIEEKPNQIKVLEQAKDAVKADGKVYISVYQGDKSGVGRATSEDSFQQMKPLSDYLEIVQEVFPDAKIVNGMIEATK